VANQNAFFKLIGENPLRSENHYCTQNMGRLFLDQPLRHRMIGNEPDFFSLSFEPEMDDALAALHIFYAQITKFFAADTVIK
jgi:hypothetical protein